MLSIRLSFALSVLLTLSACSMLGEKQEQAPIADVEANTAKVSPTVECEPSDNTAASQPIDAAVAANTPASGSETGSVPIPKSTTDKASTQGPSASALANAPGLELIGEVEYATIIPEGLRQKARIDTGAQTTSIGVDNHSFFERDGKTWVLFTIRDQKSDELIEFKRPLKRRVKIKRHEEESQRRPVVNIDLRIGNLKQQIEVTLASRDNFEYPILVGRNFLDGEAIVDVSRKFLLLDEK